MRAHITVPTLTLLLLAAAPRAEADSRDFLICIPGSQGTTASAESYLAPFFRRVESLAGWPAGVISGSYQPGYAGCMSHIRSARPGFAVMSLGAFLEQRTSRKLKVIGKVEMFAGAGQRLHLVVKRGAFKSLAELKGKTLVSNHLEETKFLNRILFGGKLDVKTHFVLRSVTQTTKGMRDVARGKADATIINDDELRTMKNRAFGKDLEVLHQSPPLPGAPLVAFMGTATSADISQVSRAISGMCKGQEGQKLCLSAGIRAMQTATQSAFAPMIRAFGK